MSYIDNFTMEEYLEEMVDNIENRVEGIPDHIANMFVKQSFSDTKKLFDENKNLDFKEVTFSIYKAYLLGLLMAKEDCSKKHIKKCGNLIVMKPRVKYYIK